MNYRVFILIFSIIYCGIQNRSPKYFSISYKSEHEFSTYKNSKTNYLTRVTYQESKAIIDLIKNDSICETKSFKIKKDSIIGNWNTIENYTIRLLFPKLKMKNNYQKKYPFEASPLIEKKNTKEWEIYKEWGLGLKSTLNGAIKILDDTIIFKTKSVENTPARLYKGNSETIITKLQKEEILKFEKKWQDCM